MHNLIECPNCFEKLEEKDSVCPRCGHELSVEQNAELNEYDKAQKKAKIVMLVMKILTGIIIVVAALLGKFFGNWWYALLGFGVGCVFTFITLFITELALHFKYRKPFEHLGGKDDKEEETKND